MTWHHDTMYSSYCLSDIHDPVGTSISRFIDSSKVKLPHSTCAILRIKLPDQLTS